MANGVYARVRVCVCVCVCLLEKVSYAGSFSIKVHMKHSNIKQENFESKGVQYKTITGYVLLLLSTDIGI
jgi:hypothetical protein